MLIKAIQQNDDWFGLVLSNNTFLVGLFICFAIPGYARNLNAPSWLLTVLIINPSFQSVIIHQHEHGERENPQNMQVLSPQIYEHLITTVIVFHWILLPNKDSRHNYKYIVMEIDMASQRKIKWIIPSIWGINNTKFHSLLECLKRSPELTQFKGCSALHGEISWATNPLKRECMLC